MTDRQPAVAIVAAGLRAHCGDGVRALSRQLGREPTFSLSRVPT